MYAQNIQEIGGPPAVRWIIFQPPPELHVGGTRPIRRLCLPKTPPKPPLIVLGTKLDGTKAYAEMAGCCLDDSWQCVAFISTHDPGWVGANSLSLVLIFSHGFR